MNNVSKTSQQILPELRRSTTAFSYYAGNDPFDPNWFEQRAAFYRRPNALGIIPHCTKPFHSDGLFESDSYSQFPSQHDEHWRLQSLQRELDDACADVDAVSLTPASAPDSPRTQCSSSSTSSETGSFVDFNDDAISGPNHPGGSRGTEQESETENSGGIDSYSTEYRRSGSTFPATTEETDTQTEGESSHQGDGDRERSDQPSEINPPLVKQSVFKDENGIINYVQEVDAYLTVHFANKKYDSMWK